MKNIATALVKAQIEMNNAKKGSSNSFFKSKYADLNSVREAVLPALNAHGISVLQPLVSIDGKNYVQTVFLHESGEKLESLTEIIYSKQNDAQSQGSGITYARRYGLQSMACVGADDDDGHKASVQGKATPNMQKQSEPAQWLTVGSTAFGKIAKLLEEGTEVSLAQIKTKYKVNKETEAKLTEIGVTA